MNQESQRVSSETKVEPENFSPASALLCLDEIMNQMPRTKLRELFGEFNELAVTLNKLIKLAKIEDKNKAL